MTILYSLLSALIQYILTDQQGSAVAALGANGQIVTGSEQRYLPPAPGLSGFGQVRAAIGSIPKFGHDVTQTDFGYTGQRNLANLGLMDYNARFYDPYLNHFTQPDTIIPSPGNSQSWDRYAYVLNNPVRYSDPSGRCQVDMGGHMTWFSDRSTQCGGSGDTMLDSNSDIVRQDFLFSRIFKGSGANGAWTARDWQKYYANRADFWRHPKKFNPSANDGPEKGWALFAKHVERLASYYTPAQKDEFVRDFALVFSGVSYYSSPLQAQWDSMGGPSVHHPGTNDPSYLVEGLGGLAPEYVDSESPQEDQSHHYAGIFFASYYSGGNIASFGNWLRDITNGGDIALGNGASSDAQNFILTTDLSSLANYILQYSK